jgi:hypothetical protein
MASVKGRNKLSDFGKYYNQRLIIGIVGYILVLGFFTILSFVLIRDWLISLTLVSSMILGIYIFSRPVEEIELSVDEDKLTIEGDEFDIEDVYSWAIKDLGEIVEIIVHVNSRMSPFRYIYVDETNPDLKLFIREFREIVFYDENTAGFDIIHLIFRNFGLK